MAAVDQEKTKGGAATGSAPQNSARGPRLIDRLASVRLTLWLLAILAASMAIATVIPQNAPQEAYLRVFGTLLGPLIAKTTLRSIYSSWWFVGAFALLVINLLACSLKRSMELLRQDRRTPSPVSRTQVLARACRARWRIPLAVAEASQALADRLSRRGYRTSLVAGEGNGQRGLIARRGRLSSWVPVMIHVGMVVVLIGAAWGRLPGNVYRSVATLRPGETFPVRIAGEAFSLRLIEAGAKRNEQGQPTDFYARVELLEEGEVIHRQVVRPNNPLRYHGVSVVLQSLLPAGYVVEVSKGESREQVPVVLTPDGTVDMMSTVRRLHDPPWVVFVHDFHEHAEPSGAKARFFVDRSGQLSHNWQLVGWVGVEGMQFEGLRFALVRSGDAAQLSLDRDIGVPIVYAGFVVIVLGTILLFGSSQRSLVALVSAKGQGSQVMVGASARGSGREAEELLKKLQSELGATLESETRKDEEAR